MDYWETAMDAETKAGGYFVAQAEDGGLLSPIIRTNLGK